MTDEYLEHYGVPGMRWGRRKGSTAYESKSSISKKEQRKQRDQSILKAREGQKARAQKLDQLAFATYAATTVKGKIAAERAYEKLHNKHVNDKNYKLASSLTSGEKIAGGLAAGVGAGIYVSALAFAMATTMRR